MREILFRGKRKDNDEWVYGDAAHSIRSANGRKLHKSWIVDGYFSNGGWLTPLTRYAVIDETVGQYTGLKDKNGTRIFEGDIIKQVIPHNLVQPFIFTVNWCEECAMFVLPCITNDAFESDFTVMRSDEIEVIGNIYDYPKLLEGE